MTKPLRVLSLGAGVQSTTLALMAAHGEIDPIDVAIFADTQSEPQAVYDHLAKLMAPGVLPFEVRIISKGSLRQELFDAAAGKRGAWGRPPLFLRNSDGTKGMTRRQCTQDYKLDPIRKEVRRLAGIKPRSPGPRRIVVQQVIGISLDEAHRMKESRHRWIELVYPLVERRLTRRQCIDKLAAWGWAAPKSACTFCPYHDDRMWADMKNTDRESFEDAVRVDRALRDGARHIRLRGIPFLHDSLQPLDEIDFDALAAIEGAKKRRGQPNLYGRFGNECEGMCGV